MLNKLTYFVQREPVTPVKRNNLLFHSLRTTLNSIATTHPIVSKYTVTVKIKNTWVWNTNHTNTAHLLANTKANVMETPTVNQPDSCGSQALQTQYTQSRLRECALTFFSWAFPELSTIVSIPHPLPPENCSRPCRWQMHSSASDSIAHRKSWRATVTDFTHQTKLRLWLKVQINTVAIPGESFSSTEFAKQESSQASPSIGIFTVSSPHY